MEVPWPFCLGSLFGLQMFANLKPSLLQSKGTAFRRTKRLNDLLKSFRTTCFGWTPKKPRWQRSWKKVVALCIHLLSNTRNFTTNKTILPGWLKLCIKAAHVATVDTPLGPILNTMSAEKVTPRRGSKRKKYLQLPDLKLRQVWPLTHYLVSFLSENSLISLGGISIFPYQAKYC